ncbi:hypothetical protein ACFQ3Z_05305 [Streptomyces nogalater]
MAAAGRAETGATLRTLSAAADYAVDKVRAVAPRVTGFPVGTRFEKWTYSRGGDWVGGFWPGTLWMAYLHSGDDTFRARAAESARNLAPARPTRPPTTSVSSSPLLGHRLAPDRRRRVAHRRDTRGGLPDTAVQPARAVHPGVGRADRHRQRGRVIIDTMMNLDLLAFASRQTGDARYLDIAVAHAKTAQRVFPRPDGSTPHVFDFDPDTGAPSAPPRCRATTPPPAGRAGRRGASTGSPPCTAGPATPGSGTPRADSPTTPSTC